MATPITWKNVPGGSSNTSSSVNASAQPYGILNSGLTSGFEQLSNVLEQYRTGEMAAAENELMAHLGQYTTPEQMAQAQASGAITGAVNDRWVNAADATRAIESRLSGLQTQARSAQEYSDYTDAVAARPHFEAISQMGALGDVEGINAYLAENGDVRGLGNHTQKVLDSIYSTQSNLAKIDSLNAQAELDKLTVAEMQRLEQERILEDELSHRFFDESRRLAANRGVYDSEHAKLLEQFGDYAALREDGSIDIEASKENAYQALLANRRAFSEAHVSQNNWNRLREEQNLSEQERIERERELRDSARENMSRLDREKQMMTGITPHNIRPARTLPEWSGEIPELMEPISIDEDLTDRYNYLREFAGPGTDTARNQELIAKLLDDGHSSSLIARAFSRGGLTSTPAASLGSDADAEAAQGAETLAAEEMLKLQDLRTVRGNFAEAANKNNILDDKQKQQATNAALQYYVQPQTMRGSNGENVEFYYPIEVLETVLSSLDTSGIFNFSSVDRQYKDALENWRLLNSKKIMEGAYTREKILEMEILRRQQNKNTKTLVDTAASVNP